MVYLSSNVYAAIIYSTLFVNLVVLGFYYFDINTSLRKITYATSILSIVNTFLMCNWIEFLIEVFYILGGKPQTKFRSCLIYTVIPIVFIIELVAIISYYVFYGLFIRDFAKLDNYANIHILAIVVFTLHTILSILFIINYFIEGRRSNAKYREFIDEEPRENPNAQPLTEEQIERARNSEIRARKQMRKKLFRHTLSICNLVVLGLFYFSTDKPDTTRKFAYINVVVYFVSELFIRYHINIMAIMLMYSGVDLRNKCVACLSIAGYFILSIGLANVIVLPNAYYIFKLSNYGSIEIYSIVVFCINTIVNATSILIIPSKLLWGKAQLDKEVRESV
jgi:hypothetical protein